MFYDYSDTQVARDLFFLERTSSSFQQLKLKQLDSMKIQEFGWISISGS